MDRSTVRHAWARIISRIGQSECRPAAMQDSFYRLVTSFKLMLNFDIFQLLQPLFFPVLTL